MADRRSEPDSVLHVRVGHLDLRSPLIGASGTCGFGQELAEFGALSALGAFVTKTLTLEPRQGNAPPRTCETRAGLINSIGLANPGIEAFRREIAPGLPSLPCPCVVNIGGKSVEEYVALAERLAGERAFAAMELNLSCPNVTGGLDLSRSRGALRAVARAIRPLWAGPLWLKLTPNVTDIRELVEEAALCGADAVVVSNTYLAMAVDWRKRRSRLGARMGGLSGPAIKPIALRLVWEAVSTRALPVIACGGITTADDVLEFLVTGASAVQVGSLLLRDPLAPREILDDLRRLLAEQGVPRLADLIGTLRG